MGKIELKEAYIINSVMKRDKKFEDCVIVYGRISGGEVLKIGDKLIDDPDTGFKCIIINFPLLRRVPFYEDHVHIIIKPEDPGYPLNAMRKMTLIKTETSSG
ncbi:hypothetical protein GCM10023310_49510 [Paenibacillus vulneris]|uniref:Uncharacterized protein n=1 Tax=Paenibacillus vulneris TaxID=1133364 RepID=A0ABW3UFC6_9BACL|nr:hypothetical protein [Paenibacillus sp. 32352]